MKWFKHLSDSINDPFIDDMIRKHGAFGYLFFFGILEIYSREFKIDPEWMLDVSLTFIRDKLREKTTKRIRYVIDSATIGRRWFVERYSIDDQQRVRIRIPKFTELLDEHTKRKLAEYEAKIGSNSRATPEQDKDKEKEKRKDKKKGGKKPKKPTIDRSSYGTEFEHVLLSDDELKKLNAKYGKPVVDDFIDQLDTYIEQKGKDPYKSHYATIIQWMRRNNVGSVNSNKGAPRCPRCETSTSSMSRGDVCDYCKREGHEVKII